ncbi:MAG: HAMP domain-containing histidine kinase [Limnothrix sp. RL_2_0]|nr:HAMP domain-containing histidine kinase [Limnothrix sp. RL_2_0]
MKLPLLKLHRLTHQVLMYILTMAVAFSLLLVALGSWNSWQIANNFKFGITTDLQLQQLSGQIIHLDEVLTMSARMAAATGDLKWETRYASFEPKLSEAIETAIALAPEAYESHAERTDAANEQLIKLEATAFQLIRENQDAEALALLFSDQYEIQKQIYADGMRQTTQTLAKRVETNIEAYGLSLSRSSLFSFISFLVLMVSWILILALISQYIESRQRAEKRLRTAKSQLEVSHAQIAVSEIALRHQTAELGQALQKLKETQSTIIQNEKMSSLGHLVAGIAHEINNPVSFIYGNIKYLQNYFDELLASVAIYQKYYPEPVAEICTHQANIELDFLQEDLPKIIDSIRLGTKRIQQIVLSLRNFSRMNEADCKNIDIHEGLDSTLLILQHRLITKSSYPEIEVVKKYGDLPLIECYGGLLNQVFMNILSNAIDALRDKQLSYLSQNNLGDRPQITVQTSALNSHYIEISISDNADGMSKAVQEKLFEPFFTTKPVGKGTGMGLSISHQIIVEKHKGKLLCFSSPGTGTEFVIQLPIVQTPVRHSPRQMVSESR